MGMNKVKYRYLGSLFLGLLSIIPFVFWVLIPKKNYKIFLLGIIILAVGRFFIANAYKIIKEYYEERIALKIRNKIRIWGFTITMIMFGLAYFQGPIFTIAIGLLLSLSLIISIYQKY